VLTIKVVHVFLFVESFTFGKREEAYYL